MGPVFVSDAIACIALRLYTHASKKADVYFLPCIKTNVEEDS